jgi:hypothetical protein
MGMKIKTISVTVAWISLLFAVSAYSQELSVPIDAEGKFELIDSKLEQELKLFPDYRGFREARLFQLSDTSFVLEISYQLEDRLLKERLPLSAQEAADFRQKVTLRIKQEKPRSALDQEGRSKLLAGTLALSLGYYGWAVPVTFDLGDGQTIAALYMLTAGAGFFLPYWGTREIPVTDAAATLSLYGGTRGIVHGIFLYKLAKGDDASGRGAVGFGMLGSITEALAFFSLANRSNMKPGTAEVICIGGDFGIGHGLGAADLADLYEDDKERALSASILLGSAAGLVAGKLLADGQPYTRGDAYVLRGVGFLGAYVSLAAADIADPEDDKVYTAAAMAGSVIGLGLGHHLVKNKDFSTGQGTLINLGELAGGLVGLGVAYLISPEGGDGNSAVYLTSSALGATGGFWLLYRSFAKDAASHNGSSWKIEIAPEAVLSYIKNDKFSRSPEQVIPAVKVRFEF